MRMRYIYRLENFTNRVGLVTPPRFQWPESVTVRAHVCVCVRAVEIQLAQRCAWPSEQ